jgi:hypothetical protein
VLSTLTRWFFFDPTSGLAELYAYSSFPSTSPVQSIGAPGDPSDGSCTHKFSPYVATTPVYISLVQDLPGLQVVAKAQIINTRAFNY